MTITVAADLIVAFLLTFTIYYAAKLSRKLSALRSDKAALQSLVQSLAQASASAEAGVKGLKATADEMGRELQRKLQAAQSLREDLAYMIDRGGTLADRMEVSLRSRREPPPEPARPRAAEAPRPPAEAPKREPRLGAGNFIQEMAARLAPNAAAAPGAPSRAERDLLRALSGRR
ncbi:MAG: DUF6468 domain-containing protein [Stellaceae bacterium]